jgi:NAD(P)-dependent dehydrogenase (short-subunit alcohol dehydrogenase family)
MKEVYNPFSIKDKKILVTGASSGIGKSIAIECAKLGAKVVITGRDITRLALTFQMLQGEGHIQLICDITSEEDINSLCNNIEKLDGVVNVAGIMKPKPFQFLTKKDIDFVMETNFLGPVLLTNQLLRKRVINKNASIVFVSSVTGVLCSFIGGSSYGASKGAINGIIKGIALELAPRGIRVNSVTPGMISTGIFNDSGITEEDMARDRLRYPLGRYGNTEDVAFAVVYLLSDASSWVTGANLLIDGGLTLI